MGTAGLLCRPPEPPLHQAEQAQLPQPQLTGAHLQLDDVPCVLGSSALHPVSEYGLRGAEQRTQLLASFWCLGFTQPQDAQGHQGTLLPLVQFAAIAPPLQAEDLALFSLNSMGVLLVHSSSLSRSLWNKNP